MPWLTGWHGDVGWLQHRRFTLGAPVVAVTSVKRNIDFAHPRIERSEDACRRAIAPGLLRNREKRWDRYHRQIRTEGQSLRDAAGDANAGERAGARAERNAVEARQRPSGFCQNGMHGGNDALRIFRSG